ncbi:TIGR03620 family F420-dependent LLM class oxidoreductase [Actinopolymorpha rutila]|uniref:Putative F420-dependent oxidoreductase n=1 Tax=Actinopolymorpha rutila TaxID=446787 RepID=A0A852ZLJ0_9ACTN|nr:TIGR03620 family F420-dependent LLM class oxidoreductase [Actinopolymorpha rutila]NYH93103.1 putative F420-dependent oxidoreductase [Actinopolymorpha rutila]
MTSTGSVATARAALGRVGVWLPPAMLDITTPEAERDAVVAAEDLGYGSLWTGDRIGGKEIFAHLGLLLAATRRLVVGAGVANIWARHPAAMQGGAATLAQAYPGRFVLGLGVSARAVVERAGGQTYDDRPLRRMRGYLDDMDAAAAAPPHPSTPFARVLGALGPRMHDLARERADGVHPFLMPVEQTARARKAVGPDKLVVPHQMVVLASNRSDVRRLVTEYVGPVLTAKQGHYATNFVRLGFDADEIGGDRFVDAVLAWGDEAAVARRVREHLAAGADHVLVQPVAPDLRTATEQFARLAPLLREV